MNRWTKVGLGACAALTMAAAEAQTLIDTIGPWNPFSLPNPSGWVVGNSTASNDPGPNNYQFYTLFSPSVSGLAGTVEAAILLQSGYPDPQMKLSIRADDHGVPGSLLAYGIAAYGYLLPGYRLSAQLNAPVQLNSDEQYWFGLSVVDPYNAAVWAANPLGITGTNAFTGGATQAPGEWYVGQSIYPTGAFAISAVPTPPAYAMLAAGLLTLTVVARRRAAAR